MQSRVKMALKKEQKVAMVIDEEIADEHMETDPDELWEDLDALKE